MKNTVNKEIIAVILVMAVIPKPFKQIMASQQSMFPAIGNAALNL
jgi:hypothetical protein